jgi:hypothetical protein
MGSGEFPTDFGICDCPDCGGAGYLPSHAVLVDWRARDLERLLEGGGAPSGADVRWLLTELRKARTALTNVIALAHDIDDSDAIGTRIRFVAGGALGLYQHDHDTDDATDSPAPR